MDNLTELIKSEIKRQYGSVKNFSAKTGISMSTLNTAFLKGIEGSSYELVTRICTILHIRHIDDEKIVYVNEEFYNLVTEFENADGRTLATVKSLLKFELERCKGDGFNGIGHVEKKGEPH